MSQWGPFAAVHDFVSSPAAVHLHEGSEQEAPILLCTSSCSLLIAPSCGGPPPHLHQLPNNAPCPHVPAAPDQKPQPALLEPQQAGDSPACPLSLLGLLPLPHGSVRLGVAPFPRLDEMVCDSFGFLDLLFMKHTFAPTGGVSKDAVSLETGDRWPTTRHFPDGSYHLRKGGKPI